MLAAGAAAWWAARPYVSTAVFIARVTGQPAWLATRLPDPARVTFVDITIPTRDGPVPARVHRPANAVVRTLVVFPGVHAGGVDEPRLTALSSRLAGTGAVVVSVPIPDLRQYRVTPRATDTIEDATSWVVSQRDLTPSGHVGLIGVSFAGGLALVAAGRPSLAGVLSAVVSIGGHGDLPRVMTYLCSGPAADDRVRPPHDYGASVMAYGAVDRLVPPDQAGPLRDALRTFLDAGNAQGTNPDEAARLLVDAERLAADLPEPARGVMRDTLARDAIALGRRLLPYIEEFGGAPALSPERSPVTGAPVFLLHGEDDDVVPATEATALALDLARRGHRAVTLEITPLISHADVRPAGSAGDAWSLLRFWKAVLATRP